MNGFSITEAALEGFRITRERPLAVLWWWAAYMVADLVQLALSALPPFRSLTEQAKALQAQMLTMQHNPGDVAAANAIVQGVIHIAGPMFLFAVVIFIVEIVLSTAVLRAVLRPADRSIGYLRLSKDEGRQIGLALLTLVVLLGYSFAVAMTSGLLIGALGGQQTALLGGGVFVIVGIAFLYPAVRLSLAPAMTFADGRISLFRSWALTEGRFWPLLGAYAIAALLGLAVVVLVTVVQVVLTVVLTGQAKPPSIDSLAQLASPVVLLTLLMNGLLSALIGVILSAPAAQAFRQIADRVGAAPTPHTGAASPWA